MGLDPVEPDWPPLATTEVRRVLSRLVPGGASATIEWRSPRPFSAAGIVRVQDAGDERRLFVKRHHRRVREMGGLEEEGCFSRHLAARGVPVPATVGSPLSDGEYLYEAQDVLAGHDLYRDALSWTPYESERHAAAAGVALARLHLASAGYEAPERAPAPLLSSAAIISSPDPLGAVARVADRRPGLADFLAARRWREEVGEALSGVQRRFLPYASALEPLWGHNDWHPSNLLWTGEGEDADVAGVIDFGLSNRTSAVYDLATAIERSVIGWLEPAEGRPVHVEQARALLSGYSSVRPLGEGEAAALPYLLPIVHVDYALSEIEYFHSVVGSKENAELAYDGYLLGHLRWFATRDGLRLCAELEKMLA